jgi:hypothetical protein
MTITPLPVDNPAHPDPVEFLFQGSTWRGYWITYLRPVPCPAQPTHKKYVLIEATDEEESVHIACESCFFSPDETPVLNFDLIAEDVALWPPAPPYN